MRCDDVVELLLADPLAQPLPNAVAERHVRTCVRCRAARAEHRRVAAALADLRDHRDALDPAAVEQAIDRLEVALAERDRAMLAHLRRRRAALAAGIAAAATAGAASALVLGGRRRGGRLVS